MTKPKNTVYCDMKDTSLCESYKNKKWCRYGFTHGVKNCPYTALGPIEARLKEEKQ
jgi:hypothetical protein